MTQSAGTGKVYLCLQCEMSESKCSCDKYCCNCYSQLGIRLCEDGLLYCASCREACGYQASAEEQ